MKNLIKKDLYQIKHNKIILISFLSIILMGIFGADSYILDLKSSKDSIGIFDAMVFDSTIIVILATLITSSLLGIEFKNRTINNLSLIHISEPTRPRLIYLLLKS